MPVHHPGRIAGDVVPQIVTFSISTCVPFRAYRSFRGLLAVGGNETMPNDDNNAVVGQPQSGIWFGKSDDLWSWGAPQGWGAHGAMSCRHCRRAGRSLSIHRFFGQKMLHLVSDKMQWVRLVTSAPFQITTLLLFTIWRHPR